MHHQIVKMNYGIVHICQLLYAAEILVNSVKEYCVSFDRPKIHNTNRQQRFIRQLHQHITNRSPAHEIHTIWMCLRV